LPPDSTIANRHQHPAGSQGKVGTAPAQARDSAGSNKGNGIGNYELDNYGSDKRAEDDNTWV